MPAHWKEASFRDRRRFLRWPTEGKLATVVSASGGWDIEPSFLVEPRRWIAPRTINGFGCLVPLNASNKLVERGLGQSLKECLPSGTLAYFFGVERPPCVKRFFRGFNPNARGLIPMILGLAPKALALVRSLL